MAKQLPDGDRKRIEQLLGAPRAAQMVAAIEAYVDGLDFFSVVMKADRTPSEKRKALLDVVKKTDKAIEAIDELPERAARVLTQRLRLDGAPDALRALQALSRAARGAADDYRTPPGARPAAVIFTQEIMSAWKKIAQNEPTTTRGGDFDQVLEIALRAAGFKSGGDTSDRTNLILRARASLKPPTD